MLDQGKLGRRQFITWISGMLATLATRPSLALGSLTRTPATAEAENSALSANEMIITFGSCNRQWVSQEHWFSVGAIEPDAWIWLGDVIYSDHIGPALRRLSYMALRNNSYYRSFRTKYRILGTWDDHDYGLNNAGAELEGKAVNQVLFLDFLGAPDEDIRRKREGVYYSEIIEKNGRKVKAILLDTRYFREKGSKDGAFLGDAQWKWLEDEITNAARECELVLLGSSVQFLGDANSADDWNGYPSERKRMRELLARCGVPVMIISGDIHSSRVQRAPLDGASGQKWLYDYTSSGLTHASIAHSGSPSLGPILDERNFGVIKISFGERGVSGIRIEMRRTDGSLFHAFEHEGLPVA